MTHNRAKSSKQNAKHNEKLLRGIKQDSAAPFFS